MKCRHLGLNSALCDWLLNFLTDRPQDSGVPQGCIPSLVGTLTFWWQDNDLQVNISKTKEKLEGSRKQQVGGHASINQYLQVPVSQYYWGPDLGSSHQYHCKRNEATADLPPQKSPYSRKVCNFHNRTTQCPDQLHHRLVGQTPRTSPAWSCRPWRSATGRRPVGLLQTPTTAVTDCSTCSQPVNKTILFHRPNECWTIWTKTVQQSHSQICTLELVHLDYFSLSSSKLCFSFTSFYCMRP